MSRLEIKRPDIIPRINQMLDDTPFDRCETVHPKIAETEKSECGCGLKPGQVREYDGRVWFNERFFEPVEKHVYRTATGGSSEPPEPVTESPSSPDTPTQFVNILKLVRGSLRADRG